MSHEQEHAIIEFPDGLPGFEGFRKFVIVSGPAVEPFTMVQGLGPDAPAFAAIDPLRVIGGYRTELDEAELTRLKADTATPLLWLALICPQESGATTVNLRAPLVINPATLCGLQHIATDSAYRFDHPLRAA